MAKWARLVENTVQETISLDPTGRFPEDFEWVPCSDEVSDRWVYNRKTKKFSAPVLPTPNAVPELPPERIEEGYKDFPPPTEIPQGT